jgi:hypothetical protein
LKYTPRASQKLRLQTRREWKRGNGLLILMMSSLENAPRRRKSGHVNYLSQHLYWYDHWKHREIHYSFFDAIIIISAIWLLTLFTSAASPRSTTMNQRRSFCITVATLSWSPLALVTADNFLPGMEGDHLSQWIHSIKDWFGSPGFLKVWRALR